MDHLRLKPMPGVSNKETTAVTMKSIKELIAEEMAAKAEQAAEAQEQARAEAEAFAAAAAAAEEAAEAERQEKARMAAQAAAARVPLKVVTEEEPRVHQNLPEITPVEESSAQAREGKSLLARWLGR